MATAAAAAPGTPLTVVPKLPDQPNAKPLKAAEVGSQSPSFEVAGASLLHALAGQVAKSPPPTGSGWYALMIGLLVVFVGGMGWVGHQVAELRSQVDKLGDQAARVEVVEDRLDRTQEALIAAQEIAIRERRWSTQILLSLWRSENPDREPPQPPDHTSEERKILFLRR